MRQNQRDALTHAGVSIGLYGMAKGGIVTGWEFWFFCFFALFLGIFACLELFFPKWME